MDPRASQAIVELETENAKLRSDLAAALEILKKREEAYTEVHRLNSVVGTYRTEAFDLQEKVQTLNLQVDELKNEVAARRKETVAAWTKRDDAERLNGELVETCAKIAENYKGMDARDRMVARLIAAEIRKQAQKRINTSPMVCSRCGLNKHDGECDMTAASIVPPS